MKTKIKIAFSVIFLAFPIFTFTNAVVAIGDMSAHKTGSAAVYLLAAVAVFAALVGVYAVLKRIANEKKISKIITPDLVITVCSIVMLAIQIYLIVRLDYKPVHDAYYVDAAARNFARDGNFGVCTQVFTARRITLRAFQTIGAYCFYCLIFTGQYT